MSWTNAYGAFLGLLCGDAAGAPLEFYEGQVPAEVVDSAMRMPGGGEPSRGRGQTTDDSELALALARALRGRAPRDGLPLDAVAMQYYEWWQSRPLDIGATCRNAFDVDTSTGRAVGTEMTERASQRNAASEANGSLMRVLPLAIWGCELSDREIVDAARKETMLSHPSQVCQDANAVYCLLVAHLIRHPGDRHGALQKAETFVLENVRSKVREWFLAESLDVSALICTTAVGHARWAFDLAIYHLRQNSSYEEAIRQTLAKGGDTDTNAAIVGGLMGALHGVDAIPEYMKTPVLAFDCANPSPGLLRPAVYRSAQVEELARSLLNDASQTRDEDELYAHAYGAFLGVLCADAAGATLEFHSETITPAHVEVAISMPGGGCWQVGRGQVTDDSEMTLSLARALSTQPPSREFPLDAVAQEYSEWCHSSPFDIGNTCRTAFRVRDDSSASETLGARMVKVATSHNTGSEANGSLMRIVPLAIWGSFLSDDQLVEYAKTEPLLSHPNQVCQDANAVYCLLVAHLIRRRGDRDGALKKAEAFVLRNIQSKVREWFLTESLDVSSLDCTHAIGHVRWAFDLAIYHLRQGSTYEAAIRHTLLKGGDTDTNAAIVGGLMGALHGVEAIPDFMKAPVLAFDCTNPGNGRRRPAEYRADQAEHLTRLLLSQARKTTAT